MTEVKQDVENVDSTKLGVQALMQILRLYFMEKEGIFCFEGRKTKAKLGGLLYRLREKITV